MLFAPLRREGSEKTERAHLSHMVMKWKITPTNCDLVPYQTLEVANLYFYPVMDVPEVISIELSRRGLPLVACVDLVNNWMLYTSRADVNTITHVFDVVHPALAVTNYSCVGSAGLLPCSSHMSSAL